MATLVATGMWLACCLQAAAPQLPWPAVAEDRLFLPFGLEWFMDAGEAKGRIVGYGEPSCGETACLWMSGHEAGTVAFEQTYHGGTLVGFTLDYVLKRDAGTHYASKVDALKRSVNTDEWIFRDLRGFPESLTDFVDDFAAENRDSRIRVKWRKGEHSEFITIEMKAK
jgi:hypothetical protein